MYVYIYEYHIYMLYYLWIYKLLLKLALLGRFLKSILMEKKWGNSYMFDSL